MGLTRKILQLFCTEIQVVYLTFSLDSPTCVLSYPIRSGADTGAGAPCCRQVVSECVAAYLQAATSGRESSVRHGVSRFTESRSSLEFSKSPRGLRAHKPRLFSQAFHITFVEIKEGKKIGVGGERRGGGEKEEKEKQEEGEVRGRRGGREGREGGRGRRGTCNLQRFSHSRRQISTLNICILILCW